MKVERQMKVYKNGRALMKVVSFPILFLLQKKTVASIMLINVLGASLFFCFAMIYGLKAIDWYDPMTRNKIVYNRKTVQPKESIGISKYRPNITLIKIIRS